MKAIVCTKYGPPDVLQLKELDKPTPRDNEVLIRVYGSTVTSVDSTFRRGDDFFARLITGVLRPKKPIPGGSLGGVVEATGEGVERFKKGDQVYGESGDGFGATAEYLCISDDGALAIKPADVTYAEAAAISYSGLTALPFLRDSGHIQSGQSVLIIGASGSVGTSAVQLACHFGADVTGVCSSTNVELVKSLGADRVIDYTAEDFAKNGQTYDIIFDTVGKSSFRRCKGSLKQDGVYLTAVLSLAILFQMLWTSKIGSRKAMIAFTGLRKPGDKVKDLNFFNELIEAGKLKPVIDRSYPLEQAAEAHRYVDTGHKKGNVVITLDPDAPA